MLFCGVHLKSVCYEGSMLCAFMLCSGGVCNLAHARAELLFQAKRNIIAINANITAINANIIAINGKYHGNKMVNIIAINGNS